MIKDPDAKSFKVNVKLRNGQVFMSKDIPSKPNGEHDRLFSFWHEGRLRLYPLDMIEYYEFIPEYDDAEEK